MTMTRYCITCKHWFIEFEEDWSDITPGNGFSSECFKGHWYIGNDVTTRDYKKAMMSAETCHDYEEDNA